MIRVRRRQVAFRAVGEQQQLGVQPVSRRPVHRPYGFGDRETPLTVRALGLRPGRSALVRIEGQAARRAARLLIAVVCGEDIAALRAADLHFRLAIRIGVSGENARREQIDGSLAVRADGLLDPEEIQHVSRSALVVRRTIQVANPLADRRPTTARRRSSVPCASSGPKATRTLSQATGLMSRPKAVQPSLWASPTVVPLPRNGSKTVTPEKSWRLIECLRQIGVARQQAAQDDAAENGTQPFRPPLVDVVNGAVDLLPPALAFRHRREEFERKVVRLDKPRRLSDVRRASLRSSLGHSLRLLPRRIWAGSRMTTGSREPGGDTPSREFVLAARTGIGDRLGNQRVRPQVERVTDDQPLRFLAAQAGPLGGILSGRVVRTGRIRVCVWATPLTSPNGVGATYIFRSRIMMSP